MFFSTTAAGSCPKTFAIAGKIASPNSPTPTRTPIIGVAKGARSGFANSQCRHERL